MKPCRVSSVGIGDGVEADDIPFRFAHLFVSSRRYRAAGFVHDTSVVGGLDFLRKQPFAALTLVGLMTNHSLCEKTRKGLVQIEVATLTQRTHVTSSECVAPLSTVLRSRPGDHVTNDNVLEFFEKRPLEPARRLNLEDTLPTANRKQRSCGNLIASTGSGGAGRAAWITEPN